MREINTEELKSIQLDILRFVDKFCKEKGIKYFLCGGTLIGAVRHHGYIPWDDDIDIMMLRPDYERFVKEFSESNTSYYKIFSHVIDKDVLFPFSKVGDTRTKLIENIRAIKDNSVNIDVFPIDYLPDDKMARERLVRKNYRRFITLRRMLTKCTSDRTMIQNLLLVPFHIFRYVYKPSKLISIITRDAISARPSDTRYCGIIVWGYGLREINNVSNFKSTSKAEFEGEYFDIPVGYDLYLKTVYGDYMKLPPEEKRVTHHHFKAYWSD